MRALCRLCGCAVCLVPCAILEASRNRRALNATLFSKLSAPIRLNRLNWGKCAGMDFYWLMGYCLEKNRGLAKRRLEGSMRAIEAPDPHQSLHPNNRSNGRYLRRRSPARRPRRGLRVRPSIARTRAFPGWSGNVSSSSEEPRVVIQLVVPDRSSFRLAGLLVRSTYRLTVASPLLPHRPTANSPPSPRRRLASPSACARRYVLTRARKASGADWWFSISRDSGSRRADATARGDE